MNWLWVGLVSVAVFVAMGSFATIAQVGKIRKPMSPETAAVVVSINIFVIVLLIAAAQNLR